MSDFTFRDPLTGIIRFNDANVIHIGYEPGSEDITITAQNDETGTSKTINVNMSGGGGSAVLGQKTITVNGTYDASDDGLDGYDQVTVNVPASGITADGIATNTEPSGNVVLTSSVTNIAEQAFTRKPIETISGAGVTELSVACFMNCNNLKTVDFPNLLTIESNAFNASSIEKIFFKNADFKTNFVAAFCMNAKKLISVVMPSVTKPLYNQAFDGCALLDNVDMTPSNIVGGAFNKCSNLSVMVLRNTTLVSLGNTSAFNNTPFATTGTGGNLYVPSALVSSYEQATNWSVLNITVNAIENSFYETHYSDGTEITT